MKELSALMGFEVPLHPKLSEFCGRDIIDFPKFLDQYRAVYGKREKGGIYYEIEMRFGKYAITLINSLT